MGRKSNEISESSKIKCISCKNDVSEKEFYNSNSHLFNGKLPFCKKCIDSFFNYYLEKYQSEDYEHPEKKAIRRLCMAFDVYFSDKIYGIALKSTEKNTNMSLVSSYFKIYSLVQYKNKTYDTTIFQEEQGGVVDTSTSTRKIDNISDETMAFFGTGFRDDDYIFLQEQYNDWTSRHECQTKSQEEMFKQICFTQLELLKATRAKEDTKDLNATFLKQLEAAKLQPKQNKGDTTSETQTLGTLIDKWENTRPLPETDEELKDVDKIGKYIDIFFRGHLSKMMGIKNAFSNLYNKFMKKYTVDKPEYDNDDNSEIIFDAIFGGDDSDEK